MTESAGGRYERRTPYDTDEVMRARAENEERLPTATINASDRQQLRRAVVEVLYGEGAQRKGTQSGLGPRTSGGGEVQSNR